MSIFLDTRGRTTLGIGICARCSCKMSLEELAPDPNAPGLMCCRDDLDQLDPWRLPARPDDKITLEFCRPDLQLTTEGPSPILFANQFLGITQIGFAHPWQANTVYQSGDSITPLSVDLETTPLPQNWWVALGAGKSGAIFPGWPDAPGVVFGDIASLTSDAPTFLQLLSDGGLSLYNGGTGDGTMVWLNLGIYPN